MCTTCEQKDTDIRRKFARSEKKKCSFGKRTHAHTCRIWNPWTSRAQIGYDKLTQDESAWLERFPTKRRKKQ